MRDAGTPVCFAAALISCTKGCSADGTFGPNAPLPEGAADPEAAEVPPTAGCLEGGIAGPEPPDKLGEADPEALVPPIAGRLEGISNPGPLGKPRLYPLSSPLTRLEL